MYNIGFVRRIMILRMPKPAIKAMAFLHEAFAREDVDIHSSFALLYFFLRLQHVTQLATQSGEGLLWFLVRNRSADL